MWTGKTFQLGESTLAISEIDGKRRAVMIPEGALLHVISGPKDDDGMLSVRWNDRTAEMFEVDVEIRGTEISSESASV